MSTTSRRTAVQALLWGSYCALSVAMLNSYMPMTSGLVAIMVLVAAGLWAGTETLRWMALRGAWLDGSLGRLALRMLAWPVVFAVAIQAGTFAITRVLVVLHAVTLPPPDPRMGWGTAMGYVANTSFMLWLWLGAWGAVQYLARWRQGEVDKWQGEAERRALELEVMRGQVNPHFIFNALNNLRALILEDPEKARDAVTRLSNTLRHTLYHGARERAPLGEEIAIVRDYVALEQLHLEDRLRVTWQVADGAEAALVPPMVLQLLVENAIKHGVSRVPGGGEVTIDIGRQGADRLVVVVGNPGRWGAEAAGTVVGIAAGAGTAHADGPAGAREGGIGMAHLRERLARAGGTGAACRVSEGEGRVTVTLEMAWMTGDGAGPAAGWPGTGSGAGSVPGGGPGSTAAASALAPAPAVSVGAASKVAAA